MSGHPMSTAARPRQQSALVALLAALVLALTSLGTAAPAAGQDASRVLVTAATGVDDAIAAIVETGGTIVNRFDTFGIVVADVTNAEALSTDARVASVAPDAEIVTKSDEDASTGELRSPSYTAAETIGAAELDVDGTGIGVAVIDTGIANNPLLSGKVIAKVDTSTTPNGRDGLGHGTFMAGLIAGQPDGQFTGVAPGAHLVDIKVANAQGRATVSGLIAGLEAAQVAQDSFGVRVILLAAGANPHEIPAETANALERTLEQLWLDGLVVVVPAGNDRTYVSTPGTSNHLITAGALDDHADADTSNDTIWENSGGNALEDISKPDVLAPGVSLVSTRAPSSAADTGNPGSRIGGRLFRGTGTSMAAAVTAGAAALLLDADESLTPDEVKTKLVTGRADNKALNVAAALNASATPSVNGDFSPIIPIPDDGPGGSVTPEGHSWIGHSWIDQSWEGHSWIGHSWIGSDWNGHSWIGHSWIDDEWVGHSWIGHSWIGHSWIGDEWVGHSWIGHSWIGHSWIGHSWIGHSWIGYEWHGNSWI